MARGQKQTNITVTCPICGKDYNKNGFASHKAACERRAGTERAVRMEYAAGVYFTVSLFPGANVDTSSYGTRASA